MILQALVEYYERRCASPDPQQRLAPYGWIRRPIDYVCVLDRTGQCVDLEFIGTVEKGARRGAPRLVPAIGKQAMKHDNSGTDANLLWDGARFALGDGSADRSRQRSFLAALDRWLPGLNDVGVNAVKTFVTALINADPAAAKTLLSRFGVADDFAAREPVLAFRLQGDFELVHERTPVSRAYAAAFEQSSRQGRTGTCLITGEPNMPLAANEFVIKGVAKASPSGANIVSFNEPSFTSYAGRVDSNFTATISRRASFAYSTALNHLLERDSPNKVQIGDATTVIWSDRDDGLDAELAAIFGDDPDAHVEAVRKRLDGARSGTIGANDSGRRFFVLGFAPNKSRLAVRFWIHETFERLAPRILQHFADLRIVRQSDKDAATPSMYWLLRAIAPQAKAENVPPRLAGEWLRAILEGTPYPTALLIAAVNRCRAEQAKKDKRSGKPLPNVPYLRAAILKACINREHRRRHPDLPPDYQFIREDLDVNQTDPAYRLGRLFAVLENIQIQSARHAKLNATIRDRYYGAASSTPGAVFPTLLRLKNAHLAQLRKREQRRDARYEKLIGEICGSVEQPLLADFPRQLDLHAQGLFALGYYHQRQSLFTRKDAASETEDTPAEED